MPPSPAFHVVDLHHTGTTLTVQWRTAPGAHARTVEASALAHIGQRVAALGEAERRAGLTRDVAELSLVTPTGPDLDTAQRALGQTLYDLFDGPERALARRLETARREGAPLHLVVRLRAADRKTLAQHPALTWHLQLIAGPEGPLALAQAPDVTIAVQLGDAEITERETVPGGRLQALFMAYSPRDVAPVLDYEAEEERILGELAPFIEDHRLVLKVAEDGSLDELRRRLARRAYDVVHLTGHGVVTPEGPRLIMEDATGARDDVSAEQLLKALRAGRAMPRLLVISSCHSADQRADLPSLAAELIQGGVPCVVGWTRPVFDDVATDAAEELYRRLCCGDLPTEAVASARRALDRDEQSLPVQGHAWATLQLLATKVPGFAINPNEEPARDAGPSAGAVYKFLGSRMRVLSEGFVGRRRELQTLGRILRHGKWTPLGEAERAVAGALVVGMKGQGKSCLVGRALDRHQQDTGELSLVVLHGALDELQLLEAFRTEAVRVGDEAAEHLLADSARPPPQRIEWLLRYRWRERRLVIVLDDFEQNLEIPGVGEARLTPLAAALLEVLLPVCRDEQPKLLVTSTARFALPAHLARTLADLPLGALDGASVRKLWMRGRSAELAGLGPEAWRTLSERFGRNARLLDWARQLLAGKPSDEIHKVMVAAGATLPIWKDQSVDDEGADNLVAAFLCHMAFDEAKRKVGPDAMTFIARARVYEVPVPMEAFAGLTVDLAVSLDQHVPALANLGLLEMGSEDDRPVYRVSSLVKPVFDAGDGQRWQVVAAEHWWKAAAQGDKWNPFKMLQAWEHAISARRQDIADQAADLLHVWLDKNGSYEYSAALGARHVAAFPDSVAGLSWAGYTRFRTGDPHEARRLLERAAALANSSAEEAERRGPVTDLFARVLAALGEYTEAARYLAELVRAEEKRHPEGSAGLGKGLHTLASILLDQGDEPNARAYLERALDIKLRVYGTENHPDIAASIHELAGVLRTQGDLPGSRARLEQALEIWRKIFGTEDHPSFAASLHELASVLRAQGDLRRARAHLEQALDILRNFHSSHEHPDIAAALHELAGVLRAQGDLPGARALLERVLDIKHKVYGTQLPPSVATTLHQLASVLRDQDDLAGARALLERALEIDQKFHGTQEHHAVVASLHELAGVIHAQGDLPSARSLLEQALDILRMLHGDQANPHTAATLHELARVLRAQGDLAGARACLERALSILHKLHGTQAHLEIAISYDGLGHCLHDLGLLADSEHAFRTALRTYEALFETRDHYMYAETEVALAMLLFQLGRPDEPRDFVAHAVAVLQAQVPSHPVLARLRSAAASR